MNTTIFDNFAVCLWTISKTPLDAVLSEKEKKKKIIITKKTMINKLKKLILVVAMLLLGVATYAVPASKTPVTIRQANGKTLTFVLSGDERVHWATTLDGYTLLTNNEGAWVYAVKDRDGNMVASSVLAVNQAERSAQDLAFLQNVQKNMHFTSAQHSALVSAWEQINDNPRTKSTSSFPTTGVDSLLLILVETPDKPFHYTQQDFVNLVSQHGYNGQGSVKDYFYDQSDGQFEMAIRVVGPYTLGHNMSYYAGDYGGLYLSRDAIYAADPDVNYTHFDNDHNGVVDGIHIIFAGTPKSSTGNEDEIWPHRSSVSNNVSRDNVRFSAYSCSAEKRYLGGSNFAMANIGTICHEFGHVLGLPDMYDTDYDQNGGTAVTTGDYDVMSNGSYNNDEATPCNWSAYEKKITRWLSKYDTLSSTRNDIRLPIANGHSDTAYCVLVNNSSEFFVLEARKKTGWDAYIPGSGILVYHGNATKFNAWANNGTNQINVNPSDRGWFIEPSNGILAHGTTSMAPFAGASNIHYFTNSSRNVISKVNGTTINNIAFTDMVQVNDTLYTFNFNSQRPMLETDNASNVTMNSFTTSGEILYNGGASVTAKGIVYSTDEACPFVQANAKYDNNLTDTVNISSCVLDNLQRATTYYFRSFITNANGTHLGPINTISTLTGYGNVSIMTASNIDSTSATVKANMTSTGMAPFVKKGFVYSSDPDVLPDVDNATVVEFTDATTGQYTHNITGLQRGHTYYVRAFVTNQYGTGYSTRISFTTLYPAISNNSISATTTQVCEGVQPGIINGSEPAGGFGNFTYKWQQKRMNQSWEDADANTSTSNNQKNYQPAVLQDSTSFRRIVYSDGVISTTSTQVMIDVRISRGGTLTFARDSVTVNDNGTFTLSNKRGNVVDWERSSDNGAHYTSLNNTSTSYNETFNQVGNFTYRVKVQIDACPVAYSNTKSVVVKTNAGINDPDRSFAFVVSPNPSADGSFAITAPIDVPAKVVVTNMLGQVVYCEDNVKVNEKIFSLNNIENGSYIVTIRTTDKFAQEKLIVNK